MIIYSVLLLILLVLSALISGAEVAFFSLGPADMDRLKEEKSKHEKVIRDLLDAPNNLLATILITNNFINVGIVILSAHITNQVFDFSNNETLGFVIQVVLITFLILLVGEVLPKIYANRKSLYFVSFMAVPMQFLKRLFRPLSRLLIASTSAIDRRVAKDTPNLSVDDLSQALELTSDESTTDHEQKILKGIVKFGNTDVKQVMKPRMDVVSLENTMSYNEVLELILKSGYSRIPVYEDDFDHIKGVLYIKDLLPHINAGNDFEWGKLLRQAFFVPENKKIDDLLKEFQEKKIHLAIAVDEYGGTSGIITLEDIIEEIVGDINDEFDTEDLVYSKLDDTNYIFEGKTPLNDFYKVMNIDGEEFEEARGEAETLAGFVLEIAGKFPEKKEKLHFADYTIAVEAMDKRRIKSLKVTRNHVKETNEPKDI